MILPREIAEELSRRFVASSAACDSSLRVVMAQQSAGEAAVYRRLVGGFMGQAYTNVLRPIWKTHPELEPPEMNEPYVEPLAELTTETKAALEAFLSGAKDALSYAKETLSPDAQVHGLAFGGLPEIEAAVHEIEAFHKHLGFLDE
jgi:hypothetical protein